MTNPSEDAPTKQFKLMVNVEKWIQGVGTDMHKEFKRGETFVADLTKEGYQELVNVRKWLVPVKDGAEKVETALEGTKTPAGAPGSPVQTDPSGAPVVNTGASSSGGGVIDTNEEKTDDAANAGGTESE
jgi:hypothetical protein